MIMKEFELSAQEVSKAVREDLKKKGLSIADAARKIGKSPQNLTNTLSGNRRMSQATAELLHLEFGYSIPFLRYGKGTLLNKEENNGSTCDNEIQSIVYSLGYVFPGNTKGLSNREKEWNRITTVFKNAFYEVNAKVAINARLNINQAIDRQFTRIATTNNERTLEASLLMYTGLLQQLCDIDGIMKYLASIPNE